MTFLPAPLAVDGARLTSSHIRKGTYASTAGVEGLVEKVDLKVSQLPVAGPGLIISPGNAIILNRYQDVPNESYVAANPANHTVGPESMPSSQPSAKSYLVLVVVGDAEFSAVGHPYMPAEPLDAEEAANFQYVRPFLVECPAGTTSFEQLNLDYPAYALARLDIPAGVTNILNSHIVDLRKMARPRTEEQWYYTSGFADSLLNTLSPAFVTFPPVTGQNFNVPIPKWATVAKVEAVVTSLKQIINKEAVGLARLNFVGGGVGANIPFNKSAPTSGNDRPDLLAMGEINVAAFAGTTKALHLECNAQAAQWAGALGTDAYTALKISVRFEEVPV